MIFGDGDHQWTKIYQDSGFFLHNFLLVHQGFFCYIVDEASLFRAYSLPDLRLHLCIKVTQEPPAGLKASLHRTYTTMISQETLDKA